MKRTTIFADEYLLDDLKSLARRSHSSVASVVREALEKYVAENRGNVSASPSFIGIGESSDGTVAERHEELLWRK
ncbi:MAG TPA: CopG family transcriptional regulator [Candidatus Deferrimicrobiaceae bacterium]|jgi:predicted transcriptional regulator